ncbi:hypothetical protein P3T35_005546 [Kitasatospora sp. GP30]|uniref:glycosyltransferase n=1 Tax=Kitasatospora sp. GP30 TaxID=3035084 RepID=UPI000CC98874|nr:glycosyltransferase [Kitasatospora sp. GP30]MDH6143511.1 hypothetical protein [Kitasatospora sp. GP30]
MILPGTDAATAEQVMPAAADPTTAGTGTDLLTAAGVPTAELWADGRRAARRPPGRGWSSYSRDHAVSAWGSPSECRPSQTRTLIARGSGAGLESVRTNPSRRWFAACRGGPSYPRGFGMVAAEALAAATPVSVFDIPCLRTLVTDRVGVRAPAGDITAYAEALTHLANARRLRGGPRGNIAATQPVLDTGPGLRGGSQRLTG